MKLMKPLITPAKNTEQTIFKFILFFILPLMTILTVYSFVFINSKKDEAATRIISDQGGNANKRIGSFFDPISRDIAYLQTLGDAGKLDPLESAAVQETLKLFSKSHLQQVRRVIFWDGKTASVYAIAQGSCTKGEETIGPEHITFLNKTLENADRDKIEWEKGLSESSVLAAMVFGSSETHDLYTVATETNAAVFFKGLEKYVTNRLFLLSDLPQRLPIRFLLDDQGRPEITETKDPVILTVYAQWKNSASKEDDAFRLIFDGKPWWVSIRRLHIKDRNLYSGYILAEAQMMSEFFKGRRTFAIVSLISFSIVPIATIFLWRRYQRDIMQSALPPAVNDMTDNQVLQTIAAGEDDRLEFKSTLRWNLRTNKPDKAMEIACLKTMAAFLNSEGGSLLVGVEDDGNILGIGADQFPNDDKFLLHFNNLINQHLGLETADSFSFDIRHLEKGDILIVDCLPSPAPVYVTHDRKEEFYVRVGPGTRPLTTRDALEYIRNHF
jgi:hypothetical protein